MTPLAAERARWEARHAAAGAAGSPSPFVERHARALASLRPGGRALDLACGSGRHARVLAEAGLVTVALDFSRAALERAAPRGSGILAVAADAARLPFGDASFDLIVQTRFLDRAIFPGLAALLAPGGVLAVETFTVAQFEATGHPRREFCLEPGELESLCRSAGTGLEPIEITENHGEAPAAGPFLAAIAARRP